jgi:hypothetical protein
LPANCENESDVSSSSEYDTNKTKDLDSFKIWHIHSASSLKKNLGSLKESPLSTKNLSDVKHPTKESRKIKEVMKRKIINLTDSSGFDSSGNGEMIAQLKEIFHITGKKSEKIQILKVLPNHWSSTKIQQELKPKITWFRLPKNEWLRNKLC